MKTFRFILLSFIVALTLGYSALVFGLPALLNSNYAVKKYENFISKKTGFPVNIQGFKLNINKDISFNLDIARVLSQNNENQSILDINNLSLSTKSLSIKPQTIALNTAYIDFSKMKAILENKKKDDNKKTTFNPSFYPMIDINKIFIKIDNDATFEIDNFHSVKHENTIVSTLLGTVKTPYTTRPVYIGKEGAIYYSDSLYLDNLSLEVGNSKLNITGDFENINVLGKSLPVDELSKNFLFFYKLRHPNKKNFLENFYNLSGTIDLDVNIRKNGLFGRAEGNNLKGDFFDFKFPVAIPHVNIHFNERKMVSKAHGTFANDPVTTDVELNGIATKDLTVDGNVDGILTKNATQKYFNPVQIVGKANAHVDYHIKDEKVTVNYKLLLDKNSDLSTKYGTLSNTDKKRQFLMTTFKDGGTINIKEYSYGFLEDNNYNVLLLGDGLCEQKGRKYPLQYLTVKTADSIPVESFKGFVKNYLPDGKLSIDLNFNAIEKNLLGNIYLTHINPRPYLFVNTLAINLEKELATLLLDGKFFNSPIKLDALMSNSFKNGVHVKDINIDLEKYEFTTHSSSQSSSDQLKTLQNKPKRKRNITVDKGHIRVGKIKHPKFELNEVNILGKLKNQIVDFEIPEISYAKGTLIAKGIYNIYSHDADIDFAAADIDSKYIAKTMFNLDDAIDGTAYATMQLKSKNNLEEIEAYSTFALNDGFLPKLGAKEFIIKRKQKNNKFKNQVEKIKKPIKFTLEKITNLDFNDKKEMGADIKGSFIIDNTSIRDLEMYTKNDYLSTFIEGSYNVDEEQANITIWGRQNKQTMKETKILKIPFSWIYKFLFKKEKSAHVNQEKINKIPPILKLNGEEKIFRVNINGNLNEDNVKVQFNDIK